MESSHDPSSLLGHDQKSIAVFLDLENLFFYVVNRFPHMDPERAVLASVDYCLDVLHKEKSLIRELKAYAGHVIPENLNVTLEERNFSVERVESRRKKTAVLLQLAMDLACHLEHSGSAMEYCIIGGNADFIPILERARSHGKGVGIYAYDAAVGKEMRQYLAEQGGKLVCIPEAVFSEALAGQGASELTEAHYVVIEVIRQYLDYLKASNEIYLTRLFRQLANHRKLRDLNNENRKALVRDLQKWGYIAVEKRKGTPDYSVVIPKHHLFFTNPDDED